MERFYDVEMKGYTSFRAGGKAAELVLVETEEELCQMLAAAASEDRPWLLLGNGSNTLITDKGFDGLVVKLGRGFDWIKTDGDCLVCGGAALMSTVARHAQTASLSGFEFASGIPGSIGGAIFMNAGAYGGEMKDIVESVDLIRPDGSEKYTVSGEAMDFAYRHSRLEKSREIVTSVRLRLVCGEREEIRARMQELTRKRNEKQPVQYPSAGSFFKRPEGYFAGKLIQDAGLKGLTVGGAQVSEQHSGFIINRGDATAGDIIDLMNLVQNTVHDQFGVWLEPEVRIVGEK